MNHYLRIACVAIGLLVAACSTGRVHRVGQATQPPALRVSLGYDGVYDSPFVLWAGWPDMPHQSARELLADALKNAIREYLGEFRTRPIDEQQDLLQRMQRAVASDAATRTGVASSVTRALQGLNLLCELLVQGGSMPPLALLPGLDATLELWLTGEGVDRIATILRAVVERPGRRLEILGDYVRVELGDVLEFTDGIDAWSQLRVLERLRVLHLAAAGGVACILDVFEACADDTDFAAAREDAQAITRAAYDELSNRIRERLDCAPLLPKMTTAALLVQTYASWVTDNKPMLRDALAGFGPDEQAFAEVAEIRDFTSFTMWLAARYEASSQPRPEPLLRFLRESYRRALVARLADIERRTREAVAAATDDREKARAGWRMIELLHRFVETLQVDL